MIITKTPLRISFFGGGTDYPDYYLKHGGQTLGVAIDKYSFITLNRLADFFDYTIKVAYSRTELAQAAEEILHPSVRECLKHLGIQRGVEIGYAGDLPARTGLGSSSSFTVGLLHALHALKGELRSHEELANEAIHVEHALIKERVGVQDQFICALGGLRKVACGKDGTVRALPVPVSATRLELLRSHLMIFYTGMRRLAHEVLDEQLSNTREGKLESELGRMAEMVDEAVALLASERDIREFGELLHEAWQVKRRLSSKITNEQIDLWYEQVRRAGAVGGKLLGAGGGGFLLVFASPESQDTVRKALADLKEVRFRFDYSGTHLVYYQAQH
ncbi:MAG: kinase [Verrucomicrobiota bacterium]